MELAEVYPVSYTHLQTEVGRANVWAAKALKGKILMHKGDIAAAKTVLADVVNNGTTS